METLSFLMLNIAILFKYEILDLKYYSIYNTTSNVNVRRDYLLSNTTTNVSININYPLSSIISARETTERKLNDCWLLFDLSSSEPVAEARSWR